MALPTAKRELVNRQMADEFMKPNKKRKFGKGGKQPSINKPDTHHGSLDLPNASLRKYSMAKGGNVASYSKMEKEHVAQMKKHGVPEKYVKQEQKEAMGMACGGGVKKYAKGGAVRADGCASKGKTKGRFV